MNFIAAKKKYGQNFLNNKVILENISSSIIVDSNDLIIEIGPGMGALTEYLFQKGCFLLCYEIDTRMKEYLDKYNTSRSKVIFDDFLKCNILEEIKEYTYRNLYVVANIPYYITSPIISKLLELNIFKEIVLLVQKEFGERLTAEPNHKEYNALTLYVDYSYDAKILFPVNKNNFVPVPKVDSVVVKMTKKDNCSNIDKDYYFKFIKLAFLNKRKQLKNNLKDYDWSKIKDILNELGYLEDVRAEQIKKEDFQVLAEKCKNIK